MARGSTVPADELPDEIKRRLDEARERANQFGDSMLAWKDELWRLHELSIKKQLGWPDLQHKIENISIVGTERRVIRSSPIAQFVGSNAKNLTLPTYVLPAIVVSLDGSETEIRAAFEAALSQALKVPFEKSGPKSNDRQISWETTFWKWRSYNIIPFAEFIAWRAAFHMKLHRKYSIAAFARQIGMGEKKAYGTEKILNDAISSLPMLMRGSRYTNEDTRMSDDDRKMWAELTADFEAAERGKARDPEDPTNPPGN